MWKWIYLLSSPRSFYTYSGRLLPVLGTLTVCFLIVGLFMGLFVAPADYQQGDAFRIIYIHVPSAILSMLIYSIMSFQAILVLVWRIKLSEIMVKVMCPVGAAMAFLALITGAIWGKPMWGTWWIWDARLTSELILFFLYIGCMAVQNAIENQQQAIRAACFVVIIGLIDLPIIHYSVYWWNTLHQGSTILQFAQPNIAATMLWPLLCMITAYLLFFILITLYSARSEVLIREKRTQWVRKIVMESTYSG